MHRDQLRKPSWVAAAAMPRPLLFLAGTARAATFVWEAPAGCPERDAVRWRVGESLGTKLANAAPLSFVAKVGRSVLKQDALLDRDALRPVCYSGKHEPHRAALSSQHLVEQNQESFDTSQHFNHPETNVFDTSWYSIDPCVGLRPRREPGSPVPAMGLCDCQHDSSAAISKLTCAGDVPR